MNSNQTFPKELKIGIVGLGRHISSYMKLFRAHPNITYVCAAELVPEKRSKYSEYIDKVYTSLDEMLEQDKEINCVAVYTQRNLHAPMVVQALRAGKHVFSAVPMGCTVEEIKSILDTVEETGNIYMMMETCYYWPCAVWARKKFRSGAFGDFVYGSAQYYHTIQDMAQAYDVNVLKEKMGVGIPPMYYSTHSVGMLFGAIDDYATEVSCFGYEDKLSPEYFGQDKNHWGNPFSNETAVFKMSKGGYARINEFRRIGNTRPTSYISNIYGANGCYENCGARHLFTSSGTSLSTRNPAEYIAEDVSAEINTYLFQKEAPGDLDVSLKYRYHTGLSPCHNYQRLPKAFLALAEQCVAEDDFTTIGHNGSHMLLLDDFVRCVLSGKQPILNAWTAARYTIPGIIAHDSAMKGGIPLPVPDFGDIPKHFSVMNDEMIS